ncbi:MAG TPA: DUF4384 domain-containing protein [Blastocatellia bacterium]|nr:DUF4384 domain-containing protein [Blastocatellia bacterium]
MKAITRWAIFSLAAFIMLSGVSSAQRKPAQAKASDEARTRGLFVKKTADAIRFVLMKEQDNTFVPVNPNQEFKSGDAVALSFESNFDGYVYVVNIDQDGKKCLIFPYAGETNNIVKSGQSYTLPRGGKWEFDENKGTEVVQVIMARDPIAFLDAALKNPGCSDLEKCCQLSSSASSAAAELGANTKKTDGAMSGPGKTEDKGFADKNLTPILPTGIRARSISFAAGKDKDEKGSVVAIDDKGASGKLKPGEAAIFEVRLKHN